MMQLVQNIYPNISGHRPAGMPVYKCAISEKNIFVLATPEEVWKLLTHPEAIPSWSLDVQEVMMKNWCAEWEADVVGNYRKMFFKDGREGTQVMTDWEPLKILGYTMIEGSPIRGLECELHVELFNLYQSVDGTEVRFLNYIEYDETRHNQSTIRRLMKQQRKNLIYLKWLAEQQNTRFQHRAM